MRKNCTFSNVFQKVKNFRFPVSLTQTDTERHTNDRRKAVIRRRGRQTDKHRDRRISKKNDEKTKRRGESAEKGETQHQE